MSEFIPDQEGLDNGLVITKGHIVTAIAIVVSTVLALGWLNFNYVSANDFRQFKSSIEERMYHTELLNKKQWIETRNYYLDDRLFELRTRQNHGHLNPDDQAIMERIAREVDRNNTDLSNLENQVNALERRLVSPNSNANN